MPVVLTTYDLSFTVKDSQEYYEILNICRKGYTHISTIYKENEGIQIRENNKGMGITINGILRGSSMGAPTTTSNLVNYMALFFLFILAIILFIYM